MNIAYTKLINGTGLVLGVIKIFAVDVRHNG